MPSQGLTSADSREATGAGTPADALGESKRMQQSTLDGFSSDDCPEKKRYRDPDWLREQYWHEGKTVRAVADAANVTQSAIRKWMDKHGIERRARGRPAKGEGRYRNADWLREQYWGQGKSTYAIADSAGVASTTIQKWMDKHGIESRGKERSPEQFGAEPLKDKRWLALRYWYDVMSCAEIADHLGTGPTTVRRWMSRHGIELRNGGEWNPHPRDRIGYGPGWNEAKRQDVRERDSHTCQDTACSVTTEEHMERYGERLHVHHLKKAREIDDDEERNAMENLIALCRDCHRKWERVAEAGISPQIPGINAD